MHYSLILSAVGLALALPVDAQLSPTSQSSTIPRYLSILDYRERLAAAIARLRPNAVIIRVDNRTLKIVEAGRTELQLNIENAFERYLSEPSNLDDLIARYARLAIGVEGEADSVNQLVVIVRPTNYLIALSARNADFEKFLKSRRMAGDLSYFLAVDSPETIRTASAEDLARWRLSEADAWKRAVANIRPRMGELASGPIEGRLHSATAIGAASGLAPSLLAEPFSCSARNPQGVASQIVLVVSKEAYVFGVPSDADSMRRFWHTAKELITGPSPFSATPLTCRKGRWTVVPVPRVSP